MVVEPIFPLAGKRIFVAGHRGMVGAAVMRILAKRGLATLAAGRDVVDLERQEAVERYFEAERPEVVILAAAHVGGIVANSTYPRDFIFKNMMIAANVIDAAHKFGTRKLVFLGSSCIYPKFAEQPIREEALLSGVLEATNEPYAVAKIAGIKLAESYRRQFGSDFISLMPTNLYGLGDNYHPENSHVIAGLIRRFHEAREAGHREVVIWGTGTPRREFLFVDDLAEACLHCLEHYSDRLHLNVGTGEDLTIADLAREIANVVGFTGELVFDTSRPDGTPRKLLDVSRIRALGWQARTPLREGLRMAYADFLAGGGRNH